MAERQRMNGRPPEGLINEVLVAIHQQWIDKPPAEKDDLQPLAIPDDLPAEEGGHHPPLV
jgi:hypothetical protein